MIIIFDWHVMNNDPITRTATIYITNGTTPYIYMKGGLDESGDLQVLLDGMETELYAAAVASGTVPTPKEQAKADRLIYLVNNPGAKQIFELSSADMEVAVNALVDVLFAGKLASDRTKMKRILAVGILVNRESVAGE